MTCGLDTGEAAIGDVEFKGVEEGVSLWGCLLWYSAGEGEGEGDVDEGGDSRDARTKCNGLLCSLIFSSVETLR